MTGLLTETNVTELAAKMDGELCFILVKIMNNKPDNFKKNCDVIFR